MGKDFYLFIQSRLGAGFGNGTTTDAVQPVNSPKNNETNVQLAIYPGIAYSLSKKIQLEGGLNNLGYVQFTHSKQTSGSSNASSASNTFSLGSNLSSFGGITVGFRVLLN